MGEGRPLQKYHRFPLCFNTRKHCKNKVQHIYGHEEEWSPEIRNSRFIRLSLWFFFSRAIFLITRNQNCFPKNAFLEVGLVSCICSGFFLGGWNLLTSLDTTNSLPFPPFPPLFGVNRLFRTSLRGFFKSTKLVFKSFSPKKPLNRCFSHHPFPSSSAPERVWDPPYPIHGRGGGGENGLCRGEEGKAAAAL